MKNLFSLIIALSFSASSLLAYQVTFTYYSVDGYSTNYTASVSPGGLFVGSGDVPSGRYIQQAFWEGKIPQTDRNNISLFVGIDEYDPEFGPGDLDTCVNDSQGMAEGFTGLGYFDEKNATILNNENATKDAIRKKISAASESLNPGDIFLYYHSSHGGDDPFCLCAYDEEYFATELAEDLAKFKDGVIIIVILDSCFSAGMIPAEAMAEAIQAEMANIKAKKCGISAAQAAADLKNDSLFITASQSDEYSYTSDFYSLFTSGLVFAFDSLTDEDQDGLISFSELFNRAYSFVALIGWQEPYISNPSLGYSLFACPIPQPESYGYLQLEDGAFGYSFPNVSQDLNITVNDAPIEEKPNYTVTKQSLKVNFKRYEFDPLFPTKFDLAFTYKFKPGIKAKVENFSATLWINKYPVVLGQTGQPSKSNKNGTTKTYEIMDYNFFSLGTFQIKVNEKKGEAKFRLKLNEVLNLWEAFTPLGEDRQLVDLTLISHGEVMSFPISVSKKYKEGKSFSATLIKK